MVDGMKDEVSKVTNKTNKNDMDSESTSLKSQANDASLEVKNSLATFLQESEDYLAFY